MRTLLKRALTFVVILLLAPALYVMAETLFPHADLNAVPALESGDLIFQTALSAQAAPIMLASGSLYTHVGMVDVQPSGVMVIQAARSVVETPLARFIHGGWGYKFTVLRYAGLSAAQRQILAAAARSYLGKPYNYVFYMGSADSVYCSQLTYLAFSNSHLPLDPLEKIGDLHMDNAPVHRLFAARWHMHPACQKEGMDYESCWQAVLREPIITPVHLAHDAHLVPVYSNYMF